MNKIKVAILGSNGMLGSMVLDVLSNDENIEVTGIDRRTIDATKEYSTSLNHHLHQYDYIINCIGVINKYIDDNDPDSVQNAIQVNSIFPHELAKTGKKIIQIATDCAFEHDVYGMTKRLGEVKSNNFANIRCSIIGPGNKDGLLDWFLGQKECQGYVHHLWNGVTTLAFAKMCLGIVKSRENPDLYDQVNFTPADWECKANLIKHIRKEFNHKCVIENCFEPDKIVDRRILENPKALLLWLMAGYKERPTISYLIKELAKYMEGKEWRGRKY